MTSFSYHTVPTMKVLLSVKVPAVLKQPCFIVTHSNCRVGPNVKMSVLSKSVDSVGTVLCFLWVYQSAGHSLTLWSIWELKGNFDGLLRLLICHCSVAKDGSVSIPSHPFRYIQSSPSWLVVGQSHRTHWQMLIMLTSHFLTSWGTDAESHNFKTSWPRLI